MCPIKSLIFLSIRFCAYLSRAANLRWKTDEYKHMYNKLKCSVIFLNSVSLLICAYSLLLGCLYSSQSSSMCFLDSVTPHQWQVSSSSGINFLIKRVPRLPSQPILSLKIYLIESIMYLLSLMYS